jgi:hypothetical protein
MACSWTALPFLPITHCVHLLGWGISRLQSPYRNKGTEKNTGKHLLQGWLVQQFRTCAVALQSGSRGSVGFLQALIGVFF